MNIDDLRSRFRAHAPDVIAGLRAKAADRTAVAREAGYRISNADSTKDPAIVRVYDEIWFLGVNASDLAADLDGISAPEIRVEINSPGGDVWDGIAIYNALRAHPAKVTTRVDGIAASIASVIAQAGDHRVMLGGSQMMIHNAWGLCVGDHADHEKMAEILAHEDELIAGIYAQRSGRTKDEFKSLMDAETWLTAEDAVELGLADEVIEPGTQARAPRLHDQITSAVDAAVEAITSAERVDALRADAGKKLSVVNREGLVGLRDHLVRLDALLNDPEPQVDAEYAARKLAHAKRENEWRASLPAHLL
jgi:ATP-dependent Clp endopeptidase proteolytic subunit ClpP